MFSHLSKAKHLTGMTREDVLSFFHIVQQYYSAPAAWVTGVFSAAFEVSDIENY